MWYGRSTATAPPPSLSRPARSRTVRSRRRGAAWRWPRRHGRARGPSLRFALGSLRFGSRVARRCDAAAATWIVRRDGPRRRRDCHVDMPWNTRVGAAAAMWIVCGALRRRRDRDAARPRPGVAARRPRRGSPSFERSRFDGCLPGRTPSPSSVSSSRGTKYGSDVTASSPACQTSSTSSSRSYFTKALKGNHPSGRTPAVPKRTLFGSPSRPGWNVGMSNLVSESFVASSTSPVAASATIRRSVGPPFARLHGIGSNACVPAAPPRSPRMI